MREDVRGRDVPGDDNDVLGFSGLPWMFLCVLPQRLLDFFDAALDAAMLSGCCGGEILANWPEL